jgi:hypothetical protein
MAGGDENGRQDSRMSVHDAFGEHSSALVEEPSDVSRARIVESEALVESWLCES